MSPIYRSRSRPSNPRRNKVDTPVNRSMKRELKQVDGPAYKVWKASNFSPNCKLQLASYGGNIPITQLQEAASSGNVIRMQSLIRRGARIGEPSTLGRTALHLAIFSHESDAVQCILDEATDDIINQKDGSGDTGLHLAIKLRKDDLVSLLVNRSDVSMTDSAGFTPLKIAMDLKSMPSSNHIIAKMVELGFPKPNFLVSPCDNFSEQLSHYWNNCASEIEELQQHGLYGFKCTLYDIMRSADDGELLSSLQGENIKKEDLEGIRGSAKCQLDSASNIYRSCITAKIDKQMRRAEVLLKVERGNEGSSVSCFSWLLSRSLKNVVVENLQSDLTQKK